MGNPPIDIVTGPILRYLGIDDDIWRGTILVVTKMETSLTEPILTYYSTATPNGRPDRVNPVMFFEDHGHRFYRFPVNIRLQEVAQTVRYEINDGVRRAEFNIPAHSQTMNVMFHSCNGFSLSVNPDDFKSCLWGDVLNNHAQSPFHVMLGGGDQIYCDAVKEYCEPVVKWCKEMKHHLHKHKLPFPREDEIETEKFFLESYISWYGYGYWRGPKGTCLRPNFPKALSMIPSVNIFDDHDLIDGFGSYKEKTMLSPVFNGIGNIGFKYYMLFQHHTAPDEDVSNEPSWVSPANKLGPYIRQPNRSVYCRLGRGMAFYGLDCRTERTLHNIVSEESYNAMFTRLQDEIAASNGEIRHLLVMLGVPIAYPRLVWLENLLTSSVMTPVRMLARHGLMDGTLNEFDGTIEILDDLNDHWCARTHKKERNQFVTRLQNLAHSSNVRITVLAGDVHLAAVGRFRARDTSVPSEADHRLMLNVVSSAITNTPPPDKLADFLNKRNKIHHFDRQTDEDMVRIFDVDVDGSPRNNKCLLPRRNWCSISEITSRPLDNAGQEVKPGALFVDNDHKSKKEKGYSNALGGLSVILHMERDQHSETAGTAPYEVIVPVYNPNYKSEAAPQGAALATAYSGSNIGASSTGESTKYVDVPAAAPGPGANTFGTQVLQH